MWSPVMKERGEFIYIVLWQEVERTMRCKARKFVFLVL